MPITVGGVCIGTVEIPEAKRISFQQIRVVINTDLGLHLCQIAIREALIGRAFDFPKSLRKRLLNSPKNATGDLKWNSVSEENLRINDFKDNFMVLKNPIGFQNSWKFDFVVVPDGDNEEVIARMAVLESMEFEEQNRQIDAKLKRNNKIQANNKVASFFNRQHFEMLFSIHPDPWKYTHPYEQTKYEQTLSLLPKEKISQAIEIACAEGHFTEQLAPKVEQLMAVDISLVAWNVLLPDAVILITLPLSIWMFLKIL